MALNNICVLINKGPPGPPGYTRPGSPGKNLFPHAIF